MSSQNHVSPAFSLVELLVVVAILGVLAALLLPALDRSKTRAKALTCSSQLKQIGVVSIAFAADNNDRLPAATMPNTNRFRSPLQPILREMGTAKVFLCPTDASRTAATNLDSLERSNTSYFVSYSARAYQPQSIIAGDRNITYNSLLMAGSGMHLYRTNSFGWWRDMHQRKGNLLLSDGSVHTTTVRKLGEHIQGQPNDSFTWYFPNEDFVITPK